MLNVVGNIAVGFFRVIVFGEWFRSCPSGK
jgi:hypothetical protein